MITDPYTKLKQKAGSRVTSEVRGKASIDDYKKTTENIKEKPLCQNNYVNESDNNCRVFAYNQKK